jgi:hypothetical protein
MRLKVGHPDAASAIHSAEDSCAPGTAEVALNVQPGIRSVIVIHADTISTLPHVHRRLSAACIIFISAIGSSEPLSDAGEMTQGHPADPGPVHHKTSF